MRSRPQKQIEQDIEAEEDVAVDLKDSGPSISSSRKNTSLIILASVILVFVCYYLFLSDIISEKIVLEPVITKPEDLIDGENVTPKEESSIFNLDDVDKKEKSNVELLEKQSKPEIPDIPELPKDVISSSESIDITKIKNENDDKNKEAIVDPKLPSATPDSIKNNNDNNKNIVIATNSEELKLRDQKIQELEVQLKEKQDLVEQVKKNNEDEKKIKEKQEEEKREAEKLNNNIFEPRYSPIVVFSDRGGVTPPLGVGQEKNIIVLKEDEIQKIEKTEKNVQVKMIEDRSRTIAQGKLLSAILETSINTEFPGPVRGIITRDVYGEAGKEVLIPRGSRLYGTYSSEIKRGQGRVNISWSRLLRPDGVSLNISLSASDQSGRAGIAGEADNRYSSLVANSLLASVLAVAGTAAAQQIMGGNAQTSTTVNASQGTTTTYGNAGNQALYDVTKTIIDIVTGIIKNTIDLNPVIRIPQGARMTVIVNNDIVIPYMRKK